MKDQKHSQLPWHLSETGFSRRSPVPTIYSTNDDLEIICKVNRDRMLSFSDQDNLSNAKFIVEACNNYEQLKEERDRLKKEIEYCRSTLKDISIGACDRPDTIEECHSLLAHIQLDASWASIASLFLPDTAEGNG